MHRAINGGDGLAPLHIVEREILSEAQLVHAIHTGRIVDHVRRGISLHRHENMHPKPIFGVHPGTHVRLDTLDPTCVPVYLYVLPFSYGYPFLIPPPLPSLPTLDVPLPFPVQVPD